MIPKSAHGLRVLIACVLGIAIWISIARIPLSPAHDFTCNHEPSCCQEGKNWLHKWDCEN